MATQNKQTRKLKAIYKENLPLGSFKKSVDLIPRVTNIAFTLEQLLPPAPPTFKDGGTAAGLIVDCVVDVCDAT